MDSRKRILNHVNVLGLLVLQLNVLGLLATEGSRYRVRVNNVVHFMIESRLKMTVRRGFRPQFQRFETNRSNQKLNVSL